jgi:FKBP12-rapamycin complex-associated protein
VTAEIPEGMNAKAISITKRISNKLTGKDFGNATLDVPQQVDKLIKQATDIVNLCQCYLGW